MKKFLTIACVALSTAAFANGCAATDSSCGSKQLSCKTTLNIIPKPAEMTVKEGSFKINESTRIVVDKQLWSGAKNLVTILAKTGMVPATRIGYTKFAPNSIAFKLDKTVAEEGYTLTVTKQNVTVTASTPAGAFYAVQTIRQMLPVCIEGKDADKAAQNLSLKAVEIKDEPRFSYRGFMIDSCRHFTEVRDLKKMIDLMALYKLNKFHWHLTEDQGWRLEIKKYPLLTMKGAYRKDTLLSHSHKIGTPEEKWEGKPYGNFYSQDEARDIVKYAAERFITVIPEIDLPGHSVAAVHAYPYLSCEGKKIDVWGRWGISADIYCAGKESTFKFVEDVLTEVIDIFPSKIIHIGGDEAKKRKWKKCSLCQNRIKELKLKDEHGLQSYFIGRVGKFLQSKNRQFIGWDEILDGGLADGAMVMSWRGSRGGRKAAAMKHFVVMSPNSHCYFDYYQSRKKQNEPLAIGGFLPVRQVYRFDPAYRVRRKAVKYILGGQANLWHEYVRTNSHRQYMAFPRLLALSECVWTPKKQKNYKGFTSRLESHYQRLDRMDVNYRRHDKK